MRPRSALALAGLFVILASVGAYLYYFHWTAPRLEPDRVTAYAYGPRGSHIRDLVVRERSVAGEELGELLGLVNEARLSQASPRPEEEDFTVVLLREDGLQYRLVPTVAAGGQEPLVALREGGQVFVGYLLSSALVDKMRELQARGDGLRTSD